MNDELRTAVARGARTDEIRALARKNGMITLKEYAKFLMAEGLTSLDEVISNLMVEN
jgi:type II secretory ATPase GspE/PulE/Tfp pilus assembly ATPase PilB-like protein